MDYPGRSPSKCKTRPKQGSAADDTGARQVTVRFGGISNYEEVLRAFKGLNANESLHCLKDDPASKPTRRLVDLEFDRTELHIRIIARHVQGRLASQAIES
jgi:hypothetical protein